MTAFEGGRDLDEEPSKLDMEWFARIAEIDGHALFIEAPTRRRRHCGLYAAAAAGVLCIAALVYGALLVTP